MDAKFIQLDIPGGMQVLPTQVAGHTFDVKTLGLLQDTTKRYVYKPLGKPECGERELQFYETLQRGVVCGGRALGGSGGGGGGDEQCTLLAEAQRLVPRFYNKLKLVVNQREHIFLKLEDLTCGMSLPCIMDVKIGKQTWDPLADEHKRAVEQQKYAQCKQVLGLCIPGFQVYSPGVSERMPQLMRHGKEYGKQLDAADFPDTMAMFLNAQRLPCEALVREVLRQLCDIRDWFRRQTIYHFYASSLLILYDYEQLRQLTSNINPPPSPPPSKLQQYNNDHNIVDQSLTNGNRSAQSHHETDRKQQQQPHQQQTTAHTLEPKHWVRVRMIDFAHVFPSECGDLDHNYLFGLQHLIAVIESLLV